MTSSSRRISLNYAIELEFFVAKEKEDHEYERRHTPSTDDSSSQQVRWACPAQADDPYQEILCHCKTNLSRLRETVIIRQSDEQLNKRSWQSARFNSWVLQPFRSAVAGSESPPEYEWHGIKLRSPLFAAEQDRADGAAQVKQCISSLQTAVYIHINSTCRFRISLQPGSGFMTLLEAKKLATVVWLTERDVLLSQHHDALHQLGFPNPITSHSITATSQLCLASSNRPQDPLLAAIMDLHVPLALQSPGTREQLWRIWGCTSIRHLSKALRGHRWQDLAFTLYVYDDDADDGTSVDAHAVGTFCYASWHLFEHYDVLGHWAKIILACGGTIYLPPDQYKALVAGIDQISKSHGASGWRLILEKMGVDMDCIAQLGGVVKGYGQI